MTNLKSRFKNFINNNPGSFFILSLSAAVIISQIPQIAIFSSVMLLPTFYFGLSYVKNIVIEKITNTVSNVKDKVMGVQKLIDYSDMALVMYKTPFNNLKQMTVRYQKSLEEGTTQFTEAFQDYLNIAKALYKSAYYKAKETVKFCVFVIQMAPDLKKDPVRTILKIMKEGRNVVRKILNGTVGEIKNSENVTVKNIAEKDESGIVIRRQKMFLNKFYNKIKQEREKYYNFGISNIFSFLRNHIIENTVSEFYIDTILDLEIKLRKSINDQNTPYINKLTELREYIFKAEGELINLCHKNKCIDKWDYVEKLQKFNKKIKIAEDKFKIYIKIKEMLIAKEDNLDVKSNIPSVKLEAKFDTPSLKENFTDKILSERDKQTENTVAK